MKPVRHLKNMQASIARMPSLSTTILKVLETCNDPNASANDIKRVISLDPVLTGQVLKLINSAYYSLTHPVASLARAIVMLGLNTVKNLALSSAVLKTIWGNGFFQNFSSDEYWTHCLCVGVVAKSLAEIKAVSPMEREGYFVAGLLHDLGKLPMNKQFPEEYGQIWDAARRDQEALHLSEGKFMGIDHCVVGGMIAKKWRLGMTLFESLSYHHNPGNCSADNREFVSIVSLANQIAIHLNIGTAGDCFIDQAMIDYLINAVGVDWPTLHDFRKKASSEIKKAEIFLEIARKG